MLLFYLIQRIAKHHSAVILARYTFQHAGPSDVALIAFTTKRRSHAFTNLELAGFFGLVLVSNNLLITIKHRGPVWNQAKPNGRVHRQRDSVKTQ